MEELGMRFWLGVVGVVVAAGIAIFIFFLVINHAFYAWGFLGTFIVVGAILLAIAWIYDRRQQHRYDDLEEE
jgi:high-affinity Fe2+/Pb2+ permease